MNIKNFLITCGGTTIHSFEKTQKDDQQKRITFGIIVLVVAAVSGLLASVAWSIPMGPWGLLIGIPWFLIMLLLERAVLQQMDAVAANKRAKELSSNNDSSEKEGKGVGVGWLLMRAVMILFICYFNSEMIRVIMFKPEIIAEIKLRQNDEVGAIVDSLSYVRADMKARVIEKENAVAEADQELANFVSSYEARISAIDDSLNYWNSKLVHEVKGPGGVSGITGDGPVAEAIRESVRNYEAQKWQLIAQRDSAKVTSVQSNSLRFAQMDLDSSRARTAREITLIDQQEKKLTDEVLARPVNGLSFMLQVLNDLASRSFLIWAVFFMFFFIEAIPVLLKFFSKNDSFIEERALEILQIRVDTKKRAFELRKQMREIEQN